MYSINCAKRKERKLRWVFLSLCLNLRKPLIQLHLSYFSLFFDYSFLLSLMRLEGAVIQKNAQEKREKASPVFSFFRFCLWTLYMFSIFCLFMDFSFVYFSVVLGSLWRVIYPFSVDNWGAEGVLKPLIWLRLWISGVGFEIAPENGEKVEITLCPFFLFLFSLVLGFFLAFCSGCRERSGEILIVFVGFVVFS